MSDVQTVISLNTKDNMINDKKLVYLAGPYIHEDKKVMQKRFKVLSKVAGKLMRDKDVYVYSPITHGHPIHQSTQFTSQFWLEFSIGMLDKCDEMYILDIPGWQESVGVTAEIEYARSNNKLLKMVTIRGKVSKYAY